MLLHGSSVCAGWSAASKQLLSGTTPTSRLKPFSPAQDSAEWVTGHCPVGNVKRKQLELETEWKWKSIMRPVKENRKKIFLWFAFASKSLLIGKGAAAKPSNRKVYFCLHWMWSLVHCIKIKCNLHSQSIRIGRVLSFNMFREQKQRADWSHLTRMHAPSDLVDRLIWLFAQNPQW